MATTSSAGRARSQLPSDRGNPRLKLGDRYAGIPVAGAIGMARRALHGGRRPVPERWERIGLLKTAGIGDTVLLSAILADLRAQRPDARVSLFVTRTNAGFAALLEGPDEVVVLPVRDPLGAARALRRRRLDVLVDFGAWPRLDALLCSLSGAVCTVGQRTRGQHRHWGYDLVLDHRADLHELDLYRRLIGTVGIRAGHDPHVAPPPGTAAPLTAPYAVLHLWPGGANFHERSWPLDHWRALAEELHGRGLDLALTGGPGDAAPTRGLVERWRAAGLRAHCAAGGSPADCLAWVAGARGVVSVNTGVMHLAAAAGVPTVGLSGPTSCRRWGPVGARARCVPSPVVPDGYLDLGFERDDRYPDAMSSITVLSVLAAWDDVTTRPGPDSRIGVAPPVR